MPASQETRGRRAVASSVVAKPGVNCWRTANARRVAFVIDAQDYFDAIGAAIARARHSVFILGWDIHSRIRLHPDRPPDPSDEFGAVLEAAADRNPNLRVRVLDWDFTFLMTSERELAPWLHLDWRTNERVALRLDGRHPIGACHHQKVVVIDDALAFVGGLDLTAQRWDTPEHRIDDPRRVDPDGRPYPPFHDVQMAVDGEAARLLGVLARERWRRATGAMLREPGARPWSTSDPWPPSLVPDLTDAHVALARTEPPYGSRPGVREIERLYADSIAAAKRWIYIENQYLSSRSIGDALCKSLAAPRGPEIVVVSPKECSGWLEEGTMGLLRHRLVKRIRAADVHGRFRILGPHLPGDCVRLNVHAKVFVADDEIVRIGSANLSNRSMGFDTECDAHVEANGDRAIARGIAHFRERLLAEHLGSEPERVAAVMAETGSLFATIDRLSGGERTLAPLDTDMPQWIDAVVPERLLTDPEQPMKALEFIEAWTPELLRDPHRRKLAPAVVGLSALLLAVRAFRSEQPLPGLAALAAGSVAGYAAVRSWLRRELRKDAACDAPTRS